MNKPLSILATGLCCQTPDSLDVFELTASRPDKSLLPAVMRRRTSLTTRLAITAATHACQHAGVEPGTMPSVFASVGGEIQVTDSLCRNLADPNGIVSPTQFHNSVHNTTAGYWSILHRCHHPSTAIAAIDDTFAMGLLEVWSQAQLCNEPILLVCYDEEWPRYLAPPTGKTALACAFILSGNDHAGTKITRPRVQQNGHRFSPQLEALARQAPAAVTIPLLQAMSNQVSCNDVPLNYAGSRWHTDVLFD